MSGRGNVGAQYRGGRGGRGGGGLFDAYGTARLGGGYGAQSGHSGFGGGGGGGGRRPFRGGDGPMGHRYEDPRRDGRVQRNQGRFGGRGRGREGRGRGGARGGGPAVANKLNSWVSDQHYQKRDTGAREQPEGVNYDAQLNKNLPMGIPRNKHGIHAVESSQRDRLVHSRASQFEAADVRSGDFLGINLEPRNVHSLLARADRTQPPGTRYNVWIKAVRDEDGLATSEAAKQLLYGSMLSETDPFAVESDQEDEAPKDGDGEVDDPSRRLTADEYMDRERQRDAAGESNYEKSTSDFTRRKEHYDDA